MLKDLKFAFSYSITRQERRVVDESLPGLTILTLVRDIPEREQKPVGEEGNVWTDYGMRWDNSGKFGHCKDA